jgi:hypothetical protein
MVFKNIVLKSNYLSKYIDDNKEIFFEILPTLKITTKFKNLNVIRGHL